MRKSCAVSSEVDKPAEECGVAGVFLKDPKANAVPLVYDALLALQHRGQESAGIAAARGDRGDDPWPEGGAIEVRKGMGLVKDVFTPEMLAPLRGPAAAGHVRYSTSGASALENAQPFVNRSRLGSLAVAHNGTLTNAHVVRELLEDGGAGFLSTSDSEVILNLIAKNYRKGLERAITDTIQFIKGSYALVVLTEDSLVAARDPNGIRPLCLGELDGGWIAASESCAVAAAGGTLVRDVEPGEMVIINSKEMLSFTYSEKTRRAVCAFEYVYFARPDSVVDGIEVYGARVRAGEILGREAPVEADLVCGVPDSGVPAAIGYSRVTGIPYGLGIVKSKYVGRTFISPEQSQREKAVLVKHHVIAGEVRDKRVVLLDDSIVRGTTSRRLAAILREAGAREVHLRVCSPPVRCPCYFGIDTPRREDLVSNVSSVEELKAALCADSLAFLSVEGLLESLAPPSRPPAAPPGAPPRKGYCLGCFTGEYPMPAGGGRR